MATEEKNAWRRKQYQKNREKILAAGREFYHRNKDTKQYYLDRKEAAKLRASRYLPGAIQRGDGNRRLDKGYRFEKLALALLPGSVHMNEDKDSKLKWDIEWNGFKIDVKSSFTKEGRSHWNFNNPNREVVDYYLLFCVHEGILEKVLLVPAIESKKTKGYAVGRSPEKKKEFAYAPAEHLIGRSYDSFKE